MMKLAVCTVLAAFSLFAQTPQIIISNYHNDATTGTIKAGLVSVSAPGRVIQTQAGATDGAVAICHDGCGIDGAVQLVAIGLEGCSFDNATTAGDWVQIASTGWQCHDSGSQTRPSSGEVVGIATTTNASAGTRLVQLQFTGGNGTAGLFSNGSLLSFGLPLSSVDPQVTTAELYDAATVTPPSSGVKASFYFNLGNLPDVAQERTFRTRENVRIAMDVPNTALSGSTKALSVYARTAATGSIAIYAAGLANAPGVNVFPMNCIATDSNQMNGGTAFAAGLMTCLEADVRSNGVYSGTGQQYGVWATANSSTTQPNSYAGFAASVWNGGIDIPNPQPFHFGLLCDDAGTDTACVRLGTTEDSINAVVGTSATGNTVTWTSGSPAYQFQKLKTGDTVCLNSIAVNCAGGILTTVASKISDLQFTTAATLTNQSGWTMGTQTDSQAIEFQTYGPDGTAIEYQNPLTVHCAQATQACVHLLSLTSSENWYFLGNSGFSLSYNGGSNTAIGQLGAPNSVQGNLYFAGGAVAGRVIAQNISAASDYLWNWPATAGASGNIFASGGGGSNPNVWYGTTGTGTTVVLSASPAFTGTPTFAANISVTGNVQVAATTTVVNGTAGTGTCSMSFRGSTFKEGICVLSGYQETGTAQTYSFPTAFSSVPVLVQNSGSSAGHCGTYDATATSSTLTLPANAAMGTQNCQIVFYGG